MKSDNLVKKEKVDKAQIKLIDIFKNLQPDYFLKKVFNNLEQKKSLNIIKYDKNLMKKLDININDYKEYSEKYSLIEIEIKPVNNKYVKFINIQKEEDLNHCHIYFDNNKKRNKKKLY